MDDERDAQAMRVVESVPVGSHVYRITTESAKYGRVTQTVAIFPDWLLSPAENLGTDMTDSERLEALTKVVVCLLRRLPLRCENVGGEPRRKCQCDACEAYPLACQLEGVEPDYPDWDN